MPLLVCDKCRTPLPGVVVNHAEPVPCPGCFSPLRADVFPAYFRPQVAGARSENVSSDEDASCFYHPAKKAVVPCGRCGRFLCALCDIDLGSGRHVCPGCLEAARLEPAKQKDRDTAGLPVQRRVAHDQLALLLSLLPVTVFGVYVSMFTSPVALYLVICYWNEPPRALPPRTRARLIIAGFLAFLQIGGWIAMFIFFLSARSNGFR